MTRSVSFDRAVDIYDATRSLPEEVMAQIVEKLVSTLERHECRRVLDVGVGTGRFALPLQQRGLQVHGIDISGEMLRRAREKSVDNLLLGDARRMPFKDKIFEASTAMHILHLMRDWREALQEVGRVTRVGLFSAISIFEKVDWPTYSYEKLLLETGWPELHPGIHERDLIHVIPPTESEFVTVHTDEKQADDILDLLERRSYSFQWEIPEGIHRSVMSQLRSEYTGRRVSSRRELRVCMWDVALFQA